MNQTNQEIRNIQLELLYLLQKVNDFCLLNDINYSLHGGTLIGAVREHGFIDWDDDADISMTRENYTKFMAAYKKHGLGKEIHFNEVKRKIYISRENRPHLWLDLFIYDFISENLILQKLKIYGIAFFLALIRTPEMLLITKKRGKYTGWKLTFITLVSKFGQIFTEQKKYEWLSKQHQRFQGNRVLIHRSNDQFHGVLEILPKEDMASYTMVPFENIKLMITVDYDHVLRRSFGDYMIPVKMESDVEAHDYARSSL